MKNLVDNPDFAELQKDLELKLQARLKETGDSFLSREQYLKEWGYEVGRHSAIPYWYSPGKGSKSTPELKVQSPGNKSL